MWALLLSYTDRKTRQPRFLPRLPWPKTLRANATTCIAITILQHWLTKRSHQPLVPKLAGVSHLDATSAPYLDFDPLTDRVIWHADQTLYDDTWAALSNMHRIRIFVNERLYDLLAGLPYTYLIMTSELNYRLRVNYNSSHAAPKSVLTTTTSASEHAAYTKNRPDEAISI